MQYGGSDPHALIVIGSIILEDKILCFVFLCVSIDFHSVAHHYLLLSNQILEWSGMGGGWRDNDVAIFNNIPQTTAFAHQAHVAPSGECYNFVTSTETLTALSVIIYISKLCFYTISPVSWHKVSYCLGTVGRKAWAWVVPSFPLRVNSEKNQHKIQKNYCL